VSAKIPFAHQLDCAEREVKYRERCYPRWVAEGKMSKATADAQLAAMKAIVETLRPLAESERLF